MANDEIEIYEVRDDPAQAVSDAVSTEIRHSVKSLSPAQLSPTQGKSPYRKIIPGGVYVPGCPPRPEARMGAFMALKRNLVRSAHRARAKLPTQEAAPSP